jgi:hypothetical protein
MRLGIVAGRQYRTGLRAHEHECAQAAVSARPPPRVEWPRERITQDQRDQIDVEDRLVLKERQHLGHITRTEAFDDGATDAGMQGHGRRV